MIQDDPSWELYRTFLGVLTQGSLSGAARELGIAQPTVGRHVDTLEKSLGLVLFTRSQVGFLPTEAALALRPLAETMASTAAALQRVASGQGDGIRGTVRITASEVVGAEVLPPILAKLRQVQPELTVELVLTNQRVWTKGFPYAWNPGREIALSDIKSMSSRRDALFIYLKSTRKPQVHVLPDGKQIVSAFTQFTGRSETN